MKYVVYITYYKGDKLPPFYIGSSTESKIHSGYNGSISSKKYKEIYRNEQKENKHLFKTRILSYHNTNEDALKEELRLQKKHCVVNNNKYFNESYAQPSGYFGRDVSGKNNPMFSKQHLESSKLLIKINNTNPPNSTREKMSNFGKLRIGDKNPNAKIIWIFNNINEVVFKCNGNLDYICKSNNLPSYKTFYRSYKNNKTIKTKGFIGWYAKLIK